MTTTDPLHPSRALIQPGVSLPVIPSCVHYAGSEKLILKSFELQSASLLVFDVCCDLEDGAPRGDEEQHLKRVLELIRKRNAPGKRVGIRIHDYASGLWISEVEQIVREIGDRIAFLTVPKVRAAAELNQVLALIRSSAQRAKLSTFIPVHVLIETHGALRDVRKIAAMREVEALEIGIMDLVSEHQGAIPEDCVRSPGQFEHALLHRAKTEIAAAALASGCIPVHNVTLDFKSTTQTAADAAVARQRFGFLRMWSIHPSQIEPIVRAMRPDFKNLERSCRILVAARKASWAPLDFEGELADRASYRSHWGLIQQARMHGVKISAEAEKLFFAPERDDG